VIVRPVILTDGPRTSAYRALVDPRDWACGFISRADVADFLVKQIDENAFLHASAHELTRTPQLRRRLRGLICELVGSVIEKTRNDRSERRRGARPPRHQLAANNFSMGLTVRWCRSFADQ
jgi:NAD(P)H-binding